MNHASRLELIRDLRERTRQIESSTHRTPETGPMAESRTLERLLLGQGLEAGTLVEWLNDGEGCGAVMLALSVAGHILRRGGVSVVIDGANEFYPPAAALLGVPLEGMVIVRPRDRRAGLWAWEQALRCGAAAITLGRVDGLNERHFHRLQLAAETGGGLGFLLRSPADRAGPSKAAVRLRVTARPGPGPLRSLGRRLRVELLHCRGGAAGEVTELELVHETSHVCLVSQLADSAAPPRAARA